MMSRQRNMDLYELGPVCPRGHKYLGQGHSLLRKSTGRCVDCAAVARNKWMAAHYDRHRAQSLASYYRHHERELRRHRANRAKPEWKAKFASYFAKPEVKERWRKTEERFRKTEKGRMYVHSKNHRRYARRYGGDAERTTPEQMIQIKAKFFGLCAYCGEASATTMDHFHPLSRSGPHIIENLVPACRLCNSSKNAHSPYDWMHTRGIPFDRVERILEHVHGRSDPKSSGFVSPSFIYSLPRPTP